LSVHGTRAKKRAASGKSGVYLFKDAGATSLRRKARNLRSRVRSYFSNRVGCDAKTVRWRARSPTSENHVRATSASAGARHNPHKHLYSPEYQRLLRDDKTYPYIKFTAAEKYPRVYFTRRIKKDGSLTFGPYFPASRRAAFSILCTSRFLVLLHGRLRQPMPGPA